MTAYTITFERQTASLGIDVTDTPTFTATLARALGIGGGGVPDGGTTGQLIYKTSNVDGEAAWGNIFYETTLANNAASFVVKDPADAYRYTALTNNGIEWYNPDGITSEELWTMDALLSGGKSLLRIAALTAALVASPVYAIENTGGVASKHSWYIGATEKMTLDATGLVGLGRAAFGSGASVADNPNFGLVTGNVPATIRSMNAWSGNYYDGWYGPVGLAIYDTMSSTVWGDLYGIDIEVKANSDSTGAVYVNGIYGGAYNYSTAGDGITGLNFTASNNAATSNSWIIGSYIRSVANASGATYSYIWGNRSLVYVQQPSTVTTLFAMQGLLDLHASGTYTTVDNLLLTSNYTGGNAIRVATNSVDYFTLSPKGAIVSATGTLTASTPLFTGSQTWNNASETFIGFRLAYTHTARAAASETFSITVDGSNSMAVRGAGDLYIANSVQFGNYVANTAGISIHGNGLLIASGGEFGLKFKDYGVLFPSNHLVAWADSVAAYSGTKDTILGRAAAASFRFGDVDAATAVAQTLRVQGVTGVADTSGAVWKFYDSPGTGLGGSGGYDWYVHPAGSTGSTQNVAAKALSIASDGSLTIEPGGLAAYDYLSPFLKLKSNLSGSVWIKNYGNGGGGLWVGASSSAPYLLYDTGNTVLKIGSDALFAWATTSNAETAPSLVLAKDAADTLALRRGGTAASPVPQTFNIYAFYAGAADYNRLSYSYNTGLNRFTIQQQRAGTGPRSDIAIYNVDGYGWVFEAGSSSSHFLAAVDNTCDIGQSGANRPRNVYVGNDLTTNRLIMPGPSTGTVGLATYDDGGPSFLITMQGTAYVALDYGFNTFNLGNATSLSWGSGAPQSGPDTRMYRDGASIIGMRNGGTAASPVPQAFRIYNFYAGAADHERLEFLWSGNTMYLRTYGQGTGTGQNLIIASTNAVLALQGGAYMSLYTGGQLRWFFDGNGHFTAATDNTYDIGASGANRPRNVYVGNDLINAGNTVSGGAFYVGGSGGYRFAGNSSLALIQDAGMTGLGFLALGGITSSFPALKRSSTELQFRLADDSGFSPMAASTLRTPKSATKTIATGAITVTAGYHTVDTEAAAASDDLDTISGGADGMLLLLRAADSARTVVMKDGTGNMQLAGDFSLDNAQDTITLLYDSGLTAWVEISRSDNGA